MINFPQIESLTVQGYHLFRGTAAKPGLSATFGRGPWVVLGANGLGKSTLLLLIKTMLTGAVRVRPAGFSGERESDLIPTDPRLFASRAGDGAKDATAKLEVSFGSKSIVLERHLRDLQLIGFVASNPVSQGTTEEDYRAVISRLSGIGDFANFVRVLEHVIFDLESKRPLVWNLQAQYEVFRALLLPVPVGKELRHLEGRIVSADSAARNLNASLYTLVTRRDRELGKRASAAHVRAQIAKLTAELDISRESELGFQRKLEDGEVRQSDARTAVFRVERDVDSAQRAYEKSKYDALRRSLVNLGTSEQYIYLKLLSDGVCIACGNATPELVKTLERRQAADKCLICGSEWQSAGKGVSISRAMLKRSQQLWAELTSARETLRVAEAELKSAEHEVRDLEGQLEAARQSVDGAEGQIRTLRRKLPDEDQALIARSESQIEALRVKVIEFRTEREEAENQIGGLLEQMRHAVEERRQEIQTRFLAYAGPFFCRRCSPCVRSTARSHWSDWQAIRVSSVRGRDDKCGN